MAKMTSINIHAYLSTGKSLTVSIAAWFLEVFDKPEEWDRSLLENFQQGIANACAQHAKQIKEQTKPMERRDPRAENIANLPRKDKCFIYTDYEVAKAIPLRYADLAYIDDKDAADFILTAVQIKNFLNMPIHQRVCQFPYEGAIVRKDLILLTIRKYCNVHGELPNWWQPTYDLRTEFHLFAEDYKARSSNHLPNRWIFKPAQGTRALGHRIIDCSSLQLAALSAPLVPYKVLEDMAAVNDTLALTRRLGIDLDKLPPYDDSDRVAQLFVANPLLIKQKKFDLRFFVLVRSFQPFEAYVHELFYARLANKPYSMDRIDDMEVALTVSAYHEDESIANQQERVYHTDFQAELDLQYGEGVVDAKQMTKHTIQAFSELFRGAEQEIGHWPNSSAYYGVDVMYECPTGSSAHGLVPVPKILEVNFMGDWHGVEVAVGSDCEKFVEWANDLYLVLAHPTITPSARLTML